jgi:hypothetical protein
VATKKKIKKKKKKKKKNLKVDLQIVIVPSIAQTNLQSSLDLQAPAGSIVAVGWKFVWIISSLNPNFNFIFNFITNPQALPTVYATI